MSEHAGQPTDAARQPLTNGMRAALRTARTKLEWRRAELTRIASEFDAAERAATAEYTSRLNQAEGRVNERRKIAQAELDKTAKELKARADAALGKARAEMESEVGAHTRKTAAMLDAANRERENGKWLAETMDESGERKAAQEFEAAAKELRSRGADVDRMRTAGEILLKQHGHAPLPASVAGASAWSSDPATMRPLVDKECQSAADGLKKLHQVVRPVASRLSTILIAALVLAIAGSVGVGLGLPDPNAAKIAAGGGAGVVVALAVMLAVRAVLRRRVPPAAQELSNELARAQDALRASYEMAESLRNQRLAVVKEHRAAEMRVVDDRFARTMETVRRRREEEEPELRARHAEIIAGIQAMQERELAAAEQVRAVAVERAEGSYRTKLERAKADREATMGRAREVREASEQALATAWHEIATGINATLRSIEDELGSSCPAWDAPTWTGYEASLTQAARGVRMGSLDVDLRQVGHDGAGAGLPATLGAPLTLDFDGVGSLLMQCGPEGRPAALECLRSIMLRIMTALPPGKAKFTIFDPVGLGESFAAFMHLADHDETLVGDKIWTESRHLEQKLTDLTEHMENVIQKYLRNEFPTIQAYNKTAGEVAEPFRFLVIADFPTNFTEAAAKRLASVVASGPRCGVFTLVLADTRNKPPAWAPLGELERASRVVTHKAGAWSVQDEELSRWPLALDRPPAEEVMTPILHAVGAAAVEGGRVRVPFETVAPEASQGLWTLSAASDLRVPLGRAGATKLQYLTLGRGTAQHALIAGRTGSGKSTLLHAIITTTAVWYSPDEVELYLVDFKKGVEFKAYASHAVPHVRVVAVESEREFGVSVLRRLDTELTRRGAMFRELGVQDLAGFRKASPNVVMPRVLLLVDEFQEFFTEDDKLAQDAMMLMDRLVRQGRAFGMHVILGSQTIGGAYSLARSTIGQMGIRIALACSEADASLIMSEDNTAPRLLHRPGEAIYNDASGAVEGNSPFQVVWLSDETRDAWLDKVEDSMARKPGHRPAAPIVFEGNVPSDLKRNHLLAALLAGLENGGRVEGSKGLPRAWLGEAIAIKDPTAILFKRQAGSNALVVGQAEQAGTGVMVSSLLSLSAFHAVEGEAGVVLHVFDTASAEGEETELTRVSRLLGAKVRLSTPRQVEAAVAEVFAELTRRAASGSGSEAPVYLLVNGLQKFRSLRKAEDDFSFGGEAGEATRADQQFVQILREGPALGIHTIARVDTQNSLERTLDRRAIREFDYRLLFQMSANDSAALIDSPAAATLGQHRGLLYSEELGQIEKFRPYHPPEAAWCEAAAERIAGAWSRV